MGNEGRRRSRHPLSNTRKDVDTVGTMENMEKLYNVDIERCLLGAILCKPSIIHDVHAMGITTKSFYRAAHKIAFTAVCDMAKGKIDIDLPTLTNWLKEHDKLVAVGGVAFVAGLGNVVPTAANWETYAKSLLDYAARRNIYDAAEKLRAVAMEAPETFRDNAQSVQIEISAALLDKANDLPTMGGQIADFELWLGERDDDSKIIKTGFSSLDKIVQMEKGSLNIIAGRPSMGKSAIALQFALNQAKAEKTIAFFALETTIPQNIARLVANISGVPLNHIKSINSTTTEEHERIIAAMDKIEQELKIFFITDCYTPPAILSKARQIQAAHGLDVVYIDHLQLIQLDGKGRNKSNTEKFTDISGLLKQMAKELNVPVVALSQLNRAVEERGDKKPQLSDLRESGALEQDADLVMLLSRPSYYDENAGNEMDINVAKNRDGETGRVALAYLLDVQRFGELAYMPVPKGFKEPNQNLTPQGKRKQQKKFESQAPGDWT